MTSPELEAGMQSYPVSLMRSGSRTRMTGSRTRSTPAVEDSVQPLTATAGAPGAYSPELAAADRPTNLEQLTSRVQLEDRAPWSAGAYIPVGVRGKRAHWSGTAWKGGESPGYGEPALPEPVTVAAAADDASLPAADDVSAPVDTQFPGDGAGSAGELTR